MARTLVESVTGTLDIELRQGESWSLEIVICDNTETALDFSSGYTGKCQVRQYQALDSTLIATPTIALAAGTNDDDPDLCVPNVTLTLDDETTAALAPGSYAYDLFVEETGSDMRVPWLAGKFIVVAGVTVE